MMWGRLPACPPMWELFGKGLGLQTHGALGELAEELSFLTRFNSAEFFGFGGN
jgi:hypothetical protein